MDKDVRAQTQRNKTLNRKKVAIIAVAVLLLGTVSTGAILGLRSFNSLKHQRDHLNSRVNELQTKTEQLQSQSKELTSSLSDANKQLKKLYDAAGQAKSSVLTATVTDATRDSRGYVHQPNNNLQVIIIDLTVKNGSSSNLYLSLGDFKLKDSDNHTYSTDLSSCWPPAANKVLLKAQSVAPSESVTGSICYGNLLVTLTGLKLYYGDKSFAIAPHDATYPTWQ